jgi:hypothetical protein
VSADSRSRYILIRDITSTKSIAAYNDYTSIDNSYYKARLVEGIEIVVEYLVFRPYIYN